MGAGPADDLAADGFGGLVDTQTGAIRAWARQNGHQVSDRGRISKTVVNAFQAAH
jgi:hypothetical protein